MFPDSFHYFGFFALSNLCCSFMGRLPCAWIRFLYAYHKLWVRYYRSMIRSGTHYQNTIWPYFSTFFAISVVEGILICFLYSKLDKYKRRSEQWPISTNQAAPVQVAPVQVATVTQPQTVGVRQTYRNKFLPHPGHPVDYPNCYTLPGLKSGLGVVVSFGVSPEF